MALEITRCVNFIWPVTSKKKKKTISKRGSFSTLIGKDREVPSKLGLSERAFLQQRATDISYVPLYMHLQSVFRWKVLQCMYSVYWGNTYNA